MHIKVDDLTHISVIDLLKLHLNGMHANSPPGSVYALDLSGLKAPDVTVWTVWKDEQAIGIGALKNMGSGQGEIKSMRTHPDHLRQGVGRIILDEIIRTAKLNHLIRLSLETGSGDGFEAALALYRAYGFENGDVFGAYEPSPFNQFFHLDLT